MNVLILGAGAREHALAWACAKSPVIGNLFVAPGNPGCATVAETVPLNLADNAQVIAFCQAESIDLVVVGPEGPLVLGLADDLVAAGIPCFGPTREAAKLEGSKGYAKDFCREVGIPTGAYRRFREPKEAKAHIRSLGAPIVVKADGLAAGKGVVVAKTLEEAEVAVDTLLSATLFRRERRSSSRNSSRARKSHFSLCATALPLCLLLVRRITSVWGTEIRDRIPAEWERILHLP